MRVFTYRRGIRPARAAICFAFACSCASLTAAAAMERPGGFDAPDLADVVQEMAANGVTITVYGSKPADSLWQSARDPAVFTAGAGDSPYFYPQVPEADAVLLRAETKYFDLDNSEPLTVKVSGLEPNTAYYYRVNDSAELVRFKTKPEPGAFAPFQFTVVSDSQGPYDAVGDRQLNKDRHVLGAFEDVNDAAKYPFNITTNAMRQNVTPDFSVHCGDIIEDARYTVQWEKELVGALRYYLTQAPVYFTMGNHEQYDPRVWRYFALPIPPDEQVPYRAFYSFDWGTAHFIVLDLANHRYEIVDIDDVPSFHTYKITQDVLGSLAALISDEVVASLSPLAGRELSASDFEQALNEAGIAAADSRAVRTAALVDVGFYKPYSVDVRNVELGRLSFMRPFSQEWRDFRFQWLERDLERNTDKKYIFVFSHHPIFYGGSLYQDLCRLFEAHRVTATFSGHVHVYAHNRRNGVHYFQAGGFSDTVFSALRDCPPETFVFQRYGPHYVVVNVEEDKAVVRGVSRENEVFEETVLMPRGRSGT